jgi:hypothetical protein
MRHAFTNQPATQLHLSRPCRAIAANDSPFFGDHPFGDGRVAGLSVRCGHGFR